jgi:hypothetical protein
MKHIQGTSRSQTLLLPACVDDYVGPDNVVRFIEAFVDSLSGLYVYWGNDRFPPVVYGWIKETCSFGTQTLSRRPEH